MKPLRQRMLEDMQIRNLAPSTQQAYIKAVANFARHFNLSPDQLGPEEIRAYQVHLVQEKQGGWGAFNTTVCALRFLYRTTLARDWRIDLIPFPRGEKKRPVVLSATEIQRFLAAIPSLRHRAILVTAYAAGLRVSDVAKLQVSDIDSDRMVIHVRQSKARSRSAGSQCASVQRANAVAAGGIGALGAADRGWTDWPVRATGAASCRSRTV